MGTSNNAAVVTRMFEEIINQGKVDLVDELFDPDFSTQTPQGTFDRDGFKQYVLGWRAGFPDIVCHVDDIIENGDHVAWSIRAVGTHSAEFMGIPATGKQVDFDSLNIAEFRNGRGYRHKVVMDTLKMVTQLGVVPEPV
jgi:predicted ester cyclase